MNDMAYEGIKMAGTAAAEHIKSNAESAYGSNKDSNRMIMEQLAKTNEAYQNRLLMPDVPQEERERLENKIEKNIEKMRELDEGNKKFLNNGFMVLPLLVPTIGGTAYLVGHAIKEAKSAE